jgi:hypothetical protein
VRTTFFHRSSATPPAAQEVVGAGSLLDAYTDTDRLRELVGLMDRAEAAPDYGRYSDAELFRAAVAARGRLNSLAEHSGRWRTYDTLDAITEELRRR